MSFLTAGKPEVRAWTIKKGTKAPEAAGKIHSDIQRGFIRAEIVSYDDLIKERNWSDYRLAMESGLSSSTIANLRRRNTVPSIPTLEAICNAFGITLSQFFDDQYNSTHLNAEQQDFFNKWIGLTAEQKKILYELVNQFK